MTPRTAIAATLCTALAATCGTAYGVERRFDPLTDVGVTQRIDEPVPLDLVFRDGRGNKVELAGLIDGDLPAIVSMNYSDCPMLCSLQLNGLVAGLKGVKGLTAGRDYRVVSVSFDPNESPSRAAATQDKYNLEYGRGQGGWHFLVADRQGRNVDIERLAEALGIRYGIDPITGEYSHPAAAALVTPGGKISQYLSGVEYDPRTLRLLITEAGQGKIGALGDLFFLTCFHYDADE
ncbi:MAG: SCO family protein, partial [Planctomycetota bacterium]